MEKMKTLTIGNSTFDIYDDEAVRIDFNNSNEGKANLINADTLGGLLASDYAKQVDLNDLKNNLENLDTGLHMELLWENASPTSDFASQDIAIGVKNKLIAIESKVNKAWGQIVVNVIETISDVAILSVCIGETNQGASRNLYFYEDKITFAGGTGNGEKHDQWFIPYRIYEIKC